MDLFWHETIHIVLSLICGYFVWRKYKRALTSFLAAFAGGVLIDLDHLYDYFLVYGFSFDLNTFLIGRHFELNNKIIVPLHAWELVILLFILFFYLKAHKKLRKIKKAYLLSLILALALGISSHLAFDNITNHIRLPGYFLIYRIANNFEIKKIITEEHYEYEMQLNKQYLQ